MYFEISNVIVIVVDGEDRHGRDIVHDETREV